MSAITSDSIPQLLADLARTRFWGSVQIDYQDGQPTLIRKTETLKTIQPTIGSNPKNEHHR